MTRHFLMVALGGAAGSVMRYLVSLYAPVLFGTNGVVNGTFLVNVIGCFLIGFLSQWLDMRQVMDAGLRLLLLTGFLGGFTTFSTFGFEGFTVLQQSVSQALLYTGGQLLLGIVGVWVGIVVCRWVIA